MADTGEPIVDPPALARWRQRTSGPLTALAVGSLPFMLLYFHWHELHRLDRRILVLLDVALFIAFTVDYVVELALTDDRLRFVRREKLALVIVLSQIVSLYRGLAGVGALRSLRIVRPILSISRALALSGAASRRGRALLRRNAARYAMGVAGFTWASAAVGFVLAEPGHNSIADGLWWALATMTTVGYGDLAPVTPAGRLIGGITMIVGVAALAVVTAKVAEVLLRPAATDPDGATETSGG